MNKKVVLITGGTSGIGLETANQLKQMGYTVVVVSKEAQTNLQQLTFQGDVTNFARMQEIAAIMHQQNLQVHVLINNAGFGISGAVELLPNQQIENMFAVNVQGIVNVTQAFLPYMQTNGKIINISSAMAFFPLPFRTIYAASKAAVLTLSQGLGLELKQFGIQVCAVCPGDVKTNFTKNRVKHMQTNQKYGDRIANATSNLDSKENKRMPASVVASAIAKQVTNKKMKPMVIVGNKYKVLYALQKMFPTAWKLSLTERFFSGR